MIKYSLQIALWKYNRQLVFVTVGIKDHERYLSGHVVYRNVYILYCVVICLFCYCVVLLYYCI